MDGTVEVMIPVDAKAAEALKQPGAREAMGRLVSDMLRAPVDVELAQAIAASKAEARAGGLTAAEIGAELDPYNAERRTPDPAD